MSPCVSRLIGSASGTFPLRTSGRSLVAHAVYASKTCLDRPVTCPRISDVVQPVLADLDSARQRRYSYMCPRHSDAEVRYGDTTGLVARNGDEDRSGRFSPSLRKKQSKTLILGSGSCQNAWKTRRNARHARVPWYVGRHRVRAQRFPPADAPSLISRRRPRRACSGGAGMVISSTPSLNVAFAWSAITPSGSGIVR